MAKKKAKKISKNTLIISGVILAVVVILALILVLNQPTPEEQVKEGCGEGTTIYSNKDLCWQKSTKSERATSWSDANEYCENLVLGDEDDWRLPTLTELQTIVEIKTGEIAINKDVFQNTEKIHYWTSTPYPNKENFHWYVHFELGQQGYAPDFMENYGVRCVRTKTLI